MRTLIAALLLLLASPAVANCYDARLVGVYDGDTIVADVTLGFDVVLSAQRIRLLGIDAPELRPLASREAAIASRDALAGKLAGAALSVCTAGRERDNFGRILAHAFADEIDLGKWMIENGHAVPYGE